MLPIGRLNTDKAQYPLWRMNHRGAARPRVSFALSGDSNPESRRILLIRHTQARVLVTLGRVGDPGSGPREQVARRALLGAQHPVAPHGA